MTPSKRRGPRARPPAKVASAGPRVLVDTGVLVALFDRLDAHHEVAAAWLADTDAIFLTVAPVLSETAFFLPARLRTALAAMAARGVLQVHVPDSAGYNRIAELFRKFADQDPDWADMELVWLAEATGIKRIATLDVADFSVYRIHGRKRFDLELLR
ncbi:MAG: type II toxin-antitoxin system VapC family toxin [Caldimonas sp.]